MDTATWAIWHDPLGYDAMRDGPPYLPGQPGGKVACQVVPWKREAAEVAPGVEAVFTACMADYGNAPKAELAVLLACFRAESMIHQAHHWQTRGQNFYGDHLLFERVYADVAGFVDSLAERAVGSGHLVYVQPLMQMSHMVEFSKLFYGDASVTPEPEVLPFLSYRALLASTVMLQRAIMSLESGGNLSGGLDNLLQGFQDRQEQLVYLLRQRTQQKTANMNPKTALTAFEHEVLIRRVASRFVQAMEFDTPYAVIMDEEGGA